MINLNELSAVPILTVEGYNVWGSWRGSSPLKYDNEGEKERGRAAFLPPLMTHCCCSPHVPSLLSFPPSSSCSLLRAGVVLETVRHLNGSHT